MNALTLLYNDYADSEKSCTKEFCAAYDYFTKGVSMQKADKIGELLCAAIDVEARAAFLAGVRTTIHLLTGGYDDD